MANEIRQPEPFALVGNPILVGGIGTGFEATLRYRIHEGHDERTGHFTVGGGTGEHGQFQMSVDVSGAAFQLDRLFVEVFEESAQDGSEIDKVIVPVIYGPRIVAGYIGFRLHVVRRGGHAVEDRAGPLRRSGPLQRHCQSQSAGYQQPQSDFPQPATEDPDWGVSVPNQAPLVGLNVV